MAEPFLTTEPMDWETRHPEHGNQPNDYLVIVDNLRDYPLGLE